MLVLMSNFYICLKYFFFLIKIEKGECTKSCRIQRQKTVVTKKYIDQTETQIY